MSADDQLRILNELGAVMDAVSAGGKPSIMRQRFDAYIALLDEELTGPAMPEPTKKLEPLPAPAKPKAVDIQTFFDRNLARHSLEKLVHLPIDGAAFERVGYDTARLVVPQAELATYKDLLARGCNFEGDGGAIVAGWYCIFADGSTAAIAITNGESDKDGAYVDAFLVIADGLHPTVPNPSLEPRRSLDEDFVFSYPDGTYKVIRLVPSTV